MGQTLSVGTHKVQAMYTPDTSGFTASTSNNYTQVVVPPTASLISIDFTSDQGQNYSQLSTAAPFHPNGTDLEATPSNQKIGDPEWQVDPNTGQVVSVPFAQPMGTQVHARVKLKVDGVPNGTPYLLEGKSPESALNFSQRGSLGLNPQNTGTTDVTCPVTLGNQVRIINQAQITWKLTLYPGTARAFTITLATMNQTVYVTYGKSVNDDTAHPLDLVTDARMKLAMDWVIYAIKQAVSDASLLPALPAGALPSPPRIVAELENQVTKLVGWNAGFRNNEFWMVAGDPNVPNDGKLHPSTDCYSISTFIRLVCQMVGIPGTITSMTFVPNVFNLPASSLLPAANASAAVRAAYQTAVWGELQDDPVPPGAEKYKNNFHLCHFQIRRQDQGVTPLDCRDCRSQLELLRDGDRARME